LNSKWHPHGRSAWGILIKAFAAAATPAVSSGFVIVDQLRANPHGKLVGVSGDSVFVESASSRLRRMSRKILNAGEFFAPVPSAAVVPLMNPIRRTLDF
jgi:hypothetical protein